MDLLKDQLETVLTMAGSSVTNRMHNGINILEMRDPDTRDIFYCAFVDNHFVGSYTSKLVESAIDSRNKPQIGLLIILLSKPKNWCPAKDLSAFLSIMHACPNS